MNDWSGFLNIMVTYLARICGREHVIYMLSEKFPVQLADIHKIDVPHLVFMSLQVQSDGVLR